MQTFPITSLPLEVVWAILDYLSFHDLLSLYAVSKSFLHLITPRVFSTISFNLSRGDVYSKLLFLESISTSSSIIAPAVKTLRIDSLKILHKDQVTDSVREIIISQTHEDGIELDKEAVQAVILEHLALSLTKLRNLETVK
jgi:F-box associated protein